MHHVLVFFLPNGKDAAALGKFVIKLVILMFLLGMALAPIFGSWGGGSSLDSNNRTPAQGAYALDQYSQCMADPNHGPAC